MFGRVLIINSASTDSDFDPSSRLVCVYCRDHPVGDNAQIRSCEKLVSPVCFTFTVKT